MLCENICMSKVYIYQKHFLIFDNEPLSGYFAPSVYIPVGRFPLTSCLCYFRVVAGISVPIR